MIDCDEIGGKHRLERRPVAPVDRVEAGEQVALDGRRVSGQLLMAGVHVRDGDRDVAFVERRHAAGEILVVQLDHGQTRCLEAAFLHVGPVVHGQSVAAHRPRLGHQCAE